MAVGEKALLAKPAKKPDWFSWSPTVGVSEPNLPNPIITSTQTQTYQLTAGSGSCAKTAQMLVQVKPIPIHLNATDTFTCGDSVKLKPGNVLMSITASEMGSTWQIKDSLGKVLFNSKPGTTFSGRYTLAAGRYQFVYAPTVIPPPLHIRIIPIAGDSLSELIGWTTDSVITRYFVVGDMSDYNYTMMPLPTRIGPFSMPYQQYVTVTNGKGCSATDSTLIIPRSLKLNAGFDKTITCGSLIYLDTLQTNLLNPSAVSFRWQSNASMQDTLSLSPVVFPNTTATYVVNASTDNFCIATDTVDVIVAALNVLAYDSLFSCNDTGSIRIATNYKGSQGLQYQWLPLVNIDSANSEKPIIYAKQPMKYELTIATWNGCKASDSATIHLRKPTPPEICIVSVSDENKNVIVWNKPMGKMPDTFNVFRETNVTDQYVKVGHVLASKPQLFLDELSAPEVQSNRYKINYVDQCKVASDQSIQHQTMHLTINKGLGNNWNLIWTKYEGFIVNTYNIYRETQVDNLSLIGTASGNSNSFTDITAPTGDLFYMVEIVSPFSCNPGKNYNTSRSNKASTKAIGMQDVLSAKQNIGIYPNPAIDKVYLQFESNNPTIISIYNLAGILLLEDKKRIMN